MPLTLPTLPQVVPAGLDMLVATGKPNQVWHVLWIRSNFDNTWRPYELDNPVSNPDKEHLSREGTFVIPFVASQQDETDNANQIRMYSEVQWIAYQWGDLNGTEIEYAECKFHGFIDVIEHSDTATTLHCLDPIGMAFNDFYHNFGTFEATAIRLLHHASDPTDNSANAGSKGIVLVPVTENNEERWVIPNSVATVSMYGDSYVGGSSDTAYSGTYNFAGESPYGSGSFAFVAGSNRRTWKMVAKLYDTGMNITTSEPDILYPGSGGKVNALDPKYWSVGTDTNDYITFIGYTPVGIVYLEWALIYIEGTNDIEHIFQKVANPDIIGAIDGSAGVSATIVAAVKPSDFIRDNIVIGATIYNETTGNSATIVRRIGRRGLETTSITGNWNPEDSFRIVSGNGNAPRWVDGTHFKLSGAYDVRTIWPSYTTINSITWNSEDGSAADLLAKIIKENCPPNYKPFWDPKVKMLRMQYVEITPHNSTTPYYTEGFGLYKSPYTFPGTNDAHELNIAEDLNIPRNDKLFATRCVVEGIQAHPDNLITDASQIVSQPPGDAVADWAINSAILPGVWRAVSEMGDHGSANYPGYPLNLIDMDAERIFAWEGTTGIGEGDTFAPIYVFDLKTVLELGMIRLWGPNSLRPEFKQGLRIEICEKDGILFDSGSSQYYINQNALWQLVHKDFYDYHLASYQEVKITDNWLTNKGRYVLVSMRPAKTNTEKWVKAGLGDIQFFRRNVSTGVAQVADLTDYIDSTTTGAASATVLQDSAATFITDGVQVGDTVKRVASSQNVLVTAVNSETEIVTASVSPNDWASGTDYTITKAVGGWVTYWADDSDNATALIHLPKIANQTFVPNPSFWSLTGNELKVGHKGSYWSNKSLSHPDACVIEARRILFEQLRSYRIVGLSSQWNISINLYHTVIIYDPRYGVSFKALVDRIEFNGDKIVLDISCFGTTAWTGEALQEPD